jgi:hypothetical protein
VAATVVTMFMLAATHVFNTLCWQTPMQAVPQVHASFEVVTTCYNSLMTIARKNGNNK